MAGFSDIFPQRINVSGAPDGMDAFFLANKVRETGGLIVHIAKNDSRA